MATELERELAEARKVYIEAKKIKPFLKATKSLLFIRMIRRKKSILIVMK